VAKLPDGTDPASLAETNPTDLARALTERVRPLSDVVVDKRVARWQVDATGGDRPDSLPRKSTGAGRRTPASPDADTSCAAE
jgi:hypothetical protein